MLVSHSHQSPDKLPKTWTKCLALWVLKGLVSAPVCGVSYCCRAWLTTPEAPQGPDAVRQNEANICILFANEQSSFLQPGSPLLRILMPLEAGVFFETHAHSFSKTLFNSLTFLWFLGFLGNKYTAGYEGLNFPLPHPSIPECLGVCLSGDREPGDSRGPRFAVSTNSMSVTGQINRSFFFNLIF